ncbi:SdpI family protein [Jonesia quinghaiensis]|uniref:SdpI family protein n=1 Tax=Jonesia quinghaiensis TaxID=262806 RepID=UPI0012FB411B|nr:SdpI family protein [Jonesia quinghaiensis]
MITRNGLEKNSVVGIRTRHTLRSDAAWHAAQRSSVPYLGTIAVVATSHASALIVVEVVGSLETVGHFLALSGFLVVVVIALVAWRVADSAAKQASEVSTESVEES